MGSIDYTGALLRGWRLLLLLGLLGALFGVAAPLSTGHGSGPIWQSSVIVASTPRTPNVKSSGDLANVIDTGVGVQQIAFYAADHSVITNAAKNAKITASQGSLLNDITILKGTKDANLTKGTRLQVVTLTVRQPSKARSVKLANAYATALGAYINSQVRQQYEAKLAQDQQTISDIEDQLSTVNNDIATIMAGGTVSNPTPVGTSSSANSTAYSSGSTTFVLMAAASTTTTAPSSSSTTTTTAGESKSGTTNTLPRSSNNPDLAVLQTQRSALNTLLSTALKAETDLTEIGPPVVGLTVLQNATPATASVVPGSAKTSLAGNKIIDAFAGLIVGAVIAAAIVLLIEVADRRIRSTARAEELFGLPVLAEIPARALPGLERPKELPPRLDVALDPWSQTAEAYRMLRMEVLLEPLAAAHAPVGNGYGNGYGNGRSYGNDRAYAPGYGYDPRGPVPGQPMFDAPHETSVVPAEHAANGDPATNGHAARQVILVVSAEREPTRAAVAANLAAAYAEAGNRALVVTVGQNGKDRSDAGPAPWPPRQDSFTAADVVPRSTQSQMDGVRRLEFDDVLDHPAQLSTLGASIIAAAREAADIVIIDGAPLLATHDTRALLPSVDVVLVVGECGRTGFRDASRAGNLLRRLGAPVLGVVLTNVRNGKNGAHQDDRRHDTPVLVGGPSSLPS